MKYLNFTSGDNKTPLAPNWDYTISFADISKEIDIEFIRQFLTEKEKELIEKYPNPEFGDGQTGLGEDSVTARFPYYTLWEFEELNHIKPIVKKHLNEYIEYLNLKKDNMYCQAWYNVMRNGQHIHRHTHCTSGYSYLSCHITISSFNTFTNYYNPYTNECFSEPNCDGKLTIFPSYISHDTTSVIDNKERITIAMDVYNQSGYDEDLYEHKKHRWHML